MTDEVVEKKAEEIKVPEVVEHTEIEKKAMNMGWRPKDQWNGSEDEFTDAGEFVRRQPLFDKIDYQSKKLKNVESTLNQLIEHHSKVRQTEYERALKELKEVRREAIKEGNAEQALVFEDKIEELEESHKKTEPVVIPQKQNEPTSEFLTWVQTNQWYVKDSDMHDFADGVAAAFIKRGEISGRAITERDVFNHVNDKIKRAYPEQFGNPNRERAGAVTNGDMNGRATKTTFKLTPEQEDVARSFEKSGVMTKAEYIAEIKKLEGVA